MPDTDWTDNELLAWLDEQLPPDRMSELETELRNSESLRHRTAGLAFSRDAGVHSVGDIWRRNRISCPSRSELGGFLLGTLEPAAEDYVDFHLRTVGCRFCLANLDDLEQSSRRDTTTATRRRRFFESSAGYLCTDEKD